MGDRRQIFFEDVNLWFYQHYDGERIMKKLQEAIRKAKDRWDDKAYCLRIIISQLIGDQWDKETGFGLWNTPIYTEYKGQDFIVNITNRTVKREDWTEPVSFEEFIRLGGEIL